MLRALIDRPYGRIVYDALTVSATVEIARGGGAPVHEDPGGCAGPRERQGAQLVGRRQCASRCTRGSLHALRPEQVLPRVHLYCPRNPGRRQLEPILRLQKRNDALPAHRRHRRLPLPRVDRLVGHLGSLPPVADAFIVIARTRARRQLGPHRQKRPRHRRETQRHACPPGPPDSATNVTSSRHLSGPQVHHPDAQGTSLEARSDQATRTDPSLTATAGEPTVAPCPAMCEMSPLTSARGSPR